MEKQMAVLSEKIMLRSRYGPISFGLVLRGSIVSWSEKEAKDLLVSRCWEGIYFYPTKTLTNEELGEKPIKIMSPYVMPALALPLDWNGDGLEELMLSDRRGFLYLVDRKGTYPDVTFDTPVLLRDAESGLVFNIPYDNPTHCLNDQNKYIEPQFHNYTYPVCYPEAGFGPNSLIIGDFSGNLWWLPDYGDGTGQPLYKGRTYRKKVENLVTAYGRDFIKDYGMDYAMPYERITDTENNPFWLGAGVDGTDYFIGSNTYPAIYDNPITKTNDLFVLAGTANRKLFYLHRVGSNDAKVPVFENMGEVILEGQTISDFGFHAALIPFKEEGWTHFYISKGNELAIFRNKRLGDIKPEFVFDGWVSQKDGITSGKIFTEILEDKQNEKRYVVDSLGSTWCGREITVEDGVVKLDDKGVPIMDQNGYFTVHGETDSIGGKHWGFHRVCRWDFDRSGKQHMIVGTDTGLLYLLVDEGRLFDLDGRIQYKSIGPLKDGNGQVIKIHNRLSIAPIDLDGDGYDDLVLGAATYQLGMRTDPNPGGGLYYLLHKGIDEYGCPKLDTVKKLNTKDWAPNIGINSMVGIQVKDIDEDGEKEVMIGIKEERYLNRIFKVSRNGIGLTYTGYVMPGVNLGGFLLDIDGDGEKEIVFAGGEQGIGYYQKYRLIRRIENESDEK